MIADRQAVAEPMLLTARETARALAVCEKTLWQLRRDGLLPTVRVGRGIRFDRRDVLAFIEGCKIKGIAVNEH
jgi:excisionase family DNA binding protein